MPTLQVQTLSLNLNDYAKSAAKEASASLTTSTSPVAESFSAPSNATAAKSTESRPSLPPRKLTVEKIKVKPKESAAENSSVNARYVMLTV